MIVFESNIYWTNRADGEVTFGIKDYFGKRWVNGKIGNHLPEHVRVVVAPAETTLWHTVCDDEWQHAHHSDCFDPIEESVTK